MIEDDDPPEGFVRLDDRAEAEDFAGPFYERVMDGGERQLGFRVQPRKLNKLGVCHGGVLALFADIQGGAVKRSHGMDVDSPTVSLNMDFVASVPSGAWVESQPALIRRTGSLLFFEAKFWAAGELCVRVNGIYKLRAPASGVALNP